MSTLQDPIHKNYPNHMLFLPFILSIAQFFLYHTQDVFKKKSTGYTKKKDVLYYRVLIPKISGIYFHTAPSVFRYHKVYNDLV